MTAGVDWGLKMKEEQTKFLYTVEVDCQCDQIKSGNTESQLPPHVRILFEEEMLKALGSYMQKP